MTTSQPGQTVSEQQFVCTWKYTPPEAEEHAEVRRGKFSLNSTSVASAFGEAKRAVCALHPEWLPERVEIVTIEEPFL